MTLPEYGAAVHALTAFTALAVLISGLDDLFIDFCYYGTQGYRRAHRARFPETTEAQLRSAPEQSIAIMIPAWHEDAVIGKMLRNTLRTVDYSNYDLFVGTYPNDEATMFAVAEVTEADARVHRIVCPHDGPTNKADCLNWIIEGIRFHGKKTGKHADIFMLHDSEDMVHPLSFKVMNYFIPKVPMVQLPVIPFETPYSSLTAGTYLDEFAESHLKDMLVRERLSGMVPSAGVGTGFSRAAIDKLCARHNNQVFNVGTFTEDYDLAFRLKDLGQSSILMQFFLERTAVVRSPWPGKGEEVKAVRELIGTREFFPDRFGDAVRQKARWTLGIVFHGWQQRGWGGGLAVRYMVWRDRKTLITNSVNMLGYLLILEAVLAGSSRHAPAFHGIAHGSWLWNVMLADGVLSANRCVQRVVTIARVSDWRQALLSVPRIIWGNVINFCAVAKATSLFIRTSYFGTKLVWAKTAHAFPSEAQLTGYKRKLGDLLLDERLVTLAQLNGALARQKENGGRLGDILVDMGSVPEPALLRTLGLQLRTDTIEIDAGTADPESAGLISEHAAREHLMLVVDSKARPVVVAAADVADARMKKWLDANLGCSYRLVLAGRRNLVDAIDRRLQSPPHAAAAPPRTLGDGTQERLQ